MQGAQGAAHAQQSASEHVQAAHRGRVALARALAAGRAAQEGPRQARELRRRTHVLAAMSRAALREAREQAAADARALDAMEVDEFQGRRAVPLPLGGPAAAPEQAPREAAGGHGHAMFDGIAHPLAGPDAPMVARDWDVPPPVAPHSPRPFAGVLEPPDHPAGVQALDRAREAFEAELEAAARMERRARAQSVANAARLGALPPPPPYARRALAAAVDARFDAELDAQRKQRRAWERSAAPSRLARPRPASPEPGAPGRASGGPRQEFNRFVGPSRAPPVDAAQPVSHPGPSRRAPVPPRAASPPPAAPLRSAALDAADAIRGNTFEVLAQLEERLFGQAATTRGALADAQRRANRAGPRTRKSRRRAAAADMSLSEREQLIAAAAAAGAQAAAREAQQAVQQATHATQPPAPQSQPPAAPVAQFPFLDVAVGEEDNAAQPWSDPAPEARAAGHSALTDAELAALVDLGLLSDSDGEADAGGPAAAPAHALASRASQAAAAARLAPPPPSSSSGDGDTQSALDAMRGAAANLAAAAARNTMAAPAAPPPGRALGDILASLSDKITSLDASLRHGGDLSGYSPRTPRDRGAAAYDPASSGASLDDVDVHLRRIKDTLAQLALPLPVSSAPETRSQWGNLPPPPQGAARAGPQASHSLAAPGAPVVDYSVFQSPSAAGAAPSPGTRAGLLEDMKVLLRDTYAPGESNPLAALLPVQGAGGLTPMRWSATGRLSPVPETGQVSSTLTSALLSAPGTRRV